MIHLRRYLAALFVLLALYSGYALAVAPWMEPPPILPKPPVAALPPVTIPDRVRDDLAALFPPDSWQNDTTKVKVIETGQATLLIQDYLPTPDGKLELRPCTIILYAAGNAAARSPGGESRRRPIVLDAPQGATLEFDHPLDMVRTQWGRVRKGTLAGEITITSPASQPGSNDEIYLKTRDVRLDRDLVFTPHAVDFRYGESSGRGSDLTITLLDRTDDKSLPRGKSAFGGVQLLKLNKLDYLHVAGAGDGFGRAPRHKEKSPSPNGAPLELTCQGPFSYDMVRQIARFDERVQVLRRLPDAPPDRLLGETLILDFAQDTPAGAAQSAAKEDPPTTATMKSANADPLAGRLKRIVAIGNPAVMESPTRALKGSAASIEYSLASRRLTLTPNSEPTEKDKSQVSLQQAGQHFVASQLQYEGTAESRLGKLWAAGPGELRMVQGPGGGNQPIVARWEEELRIRPHDKNQLISLLGAASVNLESQTRESEGRLEADELYLWVLESPEKVPGSAAHSAIRPDRLLANGRVRMTSPQLEAETGRLEAWFTMRPSSQSPATPNAAHPLALAGARNTAAPADSDGVIRQPNPQKFRVRGETIQLQLVGQERKFELEDLVIDKRAIIDEVCTREFGQQPIHIAGDRVELHHGTMPHSTITVSGKQAEAGGRGMSLLGDVINVNRGENRLWIDGRGEAILPAPPAGSGNLVPVMAMSGGPPQAGLRAPARPRPPLGAPQPIKLDWRDGLTFDGQVVTLKGEVHARTGTQRTESDSLEAVLSQRVEMTAPSAGPQSELARIIWTGAVFVENRGVDERGQQVSLDRMQVPSLTIDRLAGTMRAAGPGWVHSVRRSAAENSQPGMIRPVAQQMGAPAEKPLTNIHVAFDRGIEGQLAQRRVEFQERVRTTYAPVSNFTDHFVAERAGDLVDERSVLLTSDHLVFTELVMPSGRWPELEANGNAYLEGRSMKVQAHSIRYSGEKEVITVTGDGRADATIWHQSLPGQAPSKVVLQKCSYFLRTGAWDNGGIKHFDLRDLNKLPVQGLRPGAAR